jgi:pimeloyl-ACP methyl ester carboxylesterase
MKSKRMSVEFQGKPVRISLFHRERGTELILFIHGLGCAKESFELAFLSPELEGFSLLAPDLVGFGDSSKPKYFSYWMEDHAAVLKLSVGKIRVQKIHIVAHSMGSVVGLLLAEKLRDIVDSFFSVEGNIIAEDCGLISRRTASVSFEDFRSGLFDAMKSEVQAACDEKVMLWLGKADPLAFHRSAVSLVGWSDSGTLLQKFEAIPKRAFYVYGERNSGLAVLGKLRKAQIIGIPESGHFSMLENPRGFYRAIAEHISSTKHMV